MGVCGTHEPKVSIKNVKDHTFLKWRMTLSLYMNKMYTTVLLIYSTKGQTKNIHPKNLKPPHDTYKPDNGEDHVNRALCPKNIEIPPSARNQEYRIPRDTL
jgi:hypothetical protein